MNIILKSIQSIEIVIKHAAEPKRGEMLAVYKWLLFD